MDLLKNRQIILGLTGGIAAYKSADLTRRLRDAGAEVRVVMTAAATEFITPLTMQAVSGNPVHTELLDARAEAAMGHIELARWAELVLVAPATANFLSRLQAGRAEDLLSTLCLACDAPIAVAPAMNQAMWRDPATQENVASLRDRGIHILGPGSGSQACGDTGPGRMLEPLEIVAALEPILVNAQLAGLQVLITAGPTREALDPVRYLSNHSSGKMGFALAAAAAQAGASTTLVAGPVQLDTPPRVRRIDVESAEDMYAAVMSQLESTDLFIAAAAVADYRPEQFAQQKIKKDSQQELVLRLKRNPDIVAAVAAAEDGPFTVGFAAETQDVEAYARSKLERKGLDLIIANDVSRDGIGFNSEYNAVTVISDRGREEIEMTTKTRLAEILVARITDTLRQQGRLPSREES